MRNLPKKLLIIIIIVFVVFKFFTSQNLSKDIPIKVYVNSNEILFDVPPTIIDGRTLVPVRALLEKLGAKVEWNPETKTVTAVKAQTHIELQLENKSAIVNGKSVELDVPLKIIDGRTLVPLRFISENISSNVEWNEPAKTISITDNSTNSELDNIPNDKVRNGYDSYTWSSGTTYQGNWNNNKVNGKGTLKYASGDSYSGDFKNNKKNGSGIYTWANGESYNGNWVEDKMNGYGVYNFKNGDVYSGNWVNGKMNGEGTYKYKYGRTLTGIWKENKYSSAK